MEPLCSTSSPTTGGGLSAAPTRLPPRTGPPASPWSTGETRKKSRPTHRHGLILVFLIAAFARNASRCGKHYIICFLHWGVFVTGKDLMVRWWRAGWSGSATRCGRGGGWRRPSRQGGSSPPRGHPRRSSPSRRGKLILRSLLVCQVVSGHVITIVAITRLVILNVNSRLLKTCIG